MPDPESPAQPPPEGQPSTDAEPPPENSSSKKWLIGGIAGCSAAAIAALLVQTSRRPAAPPAAPPIPVATPAPTPEPAPIVKAEPPPEKTTDEPADHELHDAPKERVIRRPDSIELPSTKDGRVEIARARALPALRELFAAAGLHYPPERLFIRAFKRERELELWSAPELGAFRLVATYEIAGCSGGPGPKRREGDGQAPEGFYRINRFNPKSSFHLSMGLNYPNESDDILSDAKKPGHDIFIHGRASSIGCLAMGDDRMEELFIAATDTAERPIQVHVFPARMNAADWPAWRDEQTEGNPELLAFWDNLSPGFEIFERYRVLPNITVEPNGRYQFVAPGSTAGPDMRQ